MSCNFFLLLLSVTSTLFPLLGARGLRAIMETLLLEPMFEIPGSNITSVLITEDVVDGKNQPIYTRASSTSSNSSSQEEYENRSNENASRAVNN